jgi:hypothetical protein
MAQELGDLVARLERLERRIRRLHFIAWPALALTIALGLNLVWSGLRFGEYERVNANTVNAEWVETRHLVLQGGQLTIEPSPSLPQRRAFLSASGITFNNQAQECSISLGFMGDRAPPLDEKHVGGARLHFISKNKVIYSFPEP